MICHVGPLYITSLLYQRGGVNLHGKDPCSSLPPKDVLAQNNHFFLLLLKTSLFHPRVYENFYFLLPFRVSSSC